MIEKYRPPEERLKSLLQQPATRRQVLDGAGKTLVATRNRFFLKGTARPLVNMAVDAAVAQVIDPPKITEPERDLEKEDQERRAKERQLAISALQEAEEIIPVMDSIGSYEARAARAFATSARRAGFTSNAAIDFLASTRDTSSEASLGHVITLAEAGKFDEVRDLLLPKKDKYGYDNHSRHSLYAFDGPGDDKFWIDYAKLLKAHKEDPTKELRALQKATKIESWNFSPLENLAAFHFGLSGEFPKGYLQKMEHERANWGPHVMEKYMLAGDLDKAWEHFTRLNQGRKGRVERGSYSWAGFYDLTPLVEGFIQQGRLPDAISIAEKAMGQITVSADPWDTSRRHLEIVSTLTALKAKAVAPLNAPLAAEFFRRAGDMENGALKGWYVYVHDWASHYSQLARHAYEAGIDHRGAAQVGKDLLAEKFNDSTFDYDVDFFERGWFIKGAIEQLKFGDPEMAEKIQAYLQTHKDKIHDERYASHRTGIPAEYVDLLAALADFHTQKAA